MGQICNILIPAKRGGIYRPGGGMVGICEGGGGGDAALAGVSSFLAGSAGLAAAGAAPEKAAS